MYVIKGKYNNESFKGDPIVIMPDCLHPNTEVLTVDGFKRIELLQFSDEVANFNTDTEEIFFKKPKQIINRVTKDDEKLFEIESSRMWGNLLQSLTGENNGKKNN